MTADIAGASGMPFGATIDRKELSIMATDTGSTGATLSEPTDIGLRREVGLLGASWASLTSIIGSGWLFAGYLAAAACGAAAIYGWLIGAVAVIILALVHAELGGMFPVAGGTARFPHLAFGSVAGTSFGFFSWLQAVTVAPVEVYAVITYGTYYWNDAANPNSQWSNLLNASGHITDLGFVMAIVLMAFFTGINFLAVKYLSQVSNWVMWWKLLVPVLTIIVLFFYFKSANFTAGAPGGVNGTGGFNPLGWKAVFGAIPGAGIVFSYLGFEQADQLAGEVKNPQKNLPRAIIIATLIGCAVYILAQIVFIGAIPTDLLGHGFPGVAAVASDVHNHLAANASAIILYPFAAVAGLLSLGWLSTILHLDAFISPAGTAIIYQTSTSRIGYGLGRNRYYPKWAQWTDSRGVPWVSLLVSFVFGIVFLLPFPSWQSLVGLVTGASVLMYAGAPLSLSAFRGTLPDHVRPYKVRGAWWFAPLAFVAANMIIYWSGFTVIWKLGVCIVIGYAIIGFFRLLHLWGVSIFDGDPPPLDWKSAQWLPVYLIGMGIISWLGQYPVSGAGAPPINTDRIPYGWDFLVVAVFSLLIFYWAQWAKLPRQEVDRLVALQSSRMGTGQ
jgi:amino acid transporter